MTELYQSETYHPRSCCVHNEADMELEDRFETHPPDPGVDASVRILTNDCWPPGMGANLGPDHVQHIVR